MKRPIGKKKMFKEHWAKDHYVAWLDIEVGKVVRLLPNQEACLEKIGGCFPEYLYRNDRNRLLISEKYRRRE